MKLGIGVVAVGLWWFLAGGIGAGSAQTSAAETSASQRQEVVAAVPRHFPPVYDIDGEGRPIGFAVDIMDAVAKRVGLRIRYNVYEDWAAVEAALAAHEADLVPISGISKKSARTRSYSTPIHTFPVTFFVLSNSPLDTIDALAGKRVGIPETIPVREKLHGTARIDFVLFGSFPETLFALLRGNVDALAAAAPVVWRLAGEAGIDKDIRELSGPLMTVERGIGVRKDREDLLDVLDPVIREFIATPEYQGIYDRWYGWGQPYWTRARILSIVAVAVFILFGLVVYWRFTSLRRSERQRAVTEARFRALFDYAPYAINLKDRSGRIVGVNPEMRRWHKVEDEENHRLEITDILPGALGEWVSVKDREVFESGLAISYQQEVTKSDGTRFPALILKFPILDESGNVELVGTVATDISDRVAAEEALRASESHLRAIMDNTPAAIALKGPDGRFLAANRETLARYRLSADAFIGRTSLQVDGPDVAREVEEQEGLVKETGVAHTFEVTRTIGEDAERTLMVVRFPVPDEKGGGLGIGSIHFDITDRKRAEAALRESEARLSSIMDNAPVAVLLKDRNGRFLAVNQAYLDFRGLRIDQVIGRTTFDINTREAAEETTQQEKQVMETLQPETFEVTRVFPGGVEKTIMVVRFPVVGDKNAAIGVGAVGIDVTERNVMERQLAQAQKMEVVGQLTGGIAHDFNNLLQVIETNLELAGRELGEHSAVTEFVEAALHAGRRGGRLTQQLLAFSRKQTLRPQKVDVHPLLEGLLVLLSRTLGEDVRIETVIAGDARPMLVDENGLTNAILNLAVNARAAMPKGGTLTITAENRRFGGGIALENELLPPGDYVEISISDTGFGMSEETLKRAFEPFFTTKEVGEGSGLGLSMVYGFARQSGGNVTIESGLGEGTTVRLLLPTATARLESARNGEAANLALEQGVRVLVVEDDAAVRAATVRLLKSLGCSVVEVENAEPVIGILEHDDGIDLLLSDIVLPGGTNGIELALRAQCLRPDLKVVLVSGYPEGTLENAGLAETGFPLVGKPFSKAALSSALRAAMDR